VTAEIAIIAITSSVSSVVLWRKIPLSSTDWSRNGETMPNPALNTIIASTSARRPR